MKLRSNKAVKAGVGGRPPRAPRGGEPPRAKASTQPHHAERTPERQRFTKNQRSKFDTADVVVPKHAKKPSGGSRYKPRH